jgi:hypothetical protein
MTKVLEKIRKGLVLLETGKFQSAIKKFTDASSEKKGTDLQRAVASFFAYETAKYRREWKKRSLFRNANLFAYFESENAGKAWSDVDIGAVLVSPDTEKMDKFLTRFLGRNRQAVKFQRRYANGRPLGSWLSESGKYYTRYRQNLAVKNRLGL